MICIFMNLCNVQRGQTRKRNKKRKVCPIEVKSSSYKNHKSFDLFSKKYPIKLEDKYIIYAKDVQYEDGITYIPFYMTMCL